MHRNRSPSPSPEVLKTMNRFDAIRWLRRIAHFLLLLLLFLQISFLYFFVLGKEIHLPKQIMDSVAKRMVSEPYSIEIGSTRINQWGEIYFERITVWDKSNKKKVAFVPSAQIHIFLPALFLGKVDVRHFSFENLSISLPGKKPGDYTDSIIVNALAVSPRKDEWLIHDLRAKLGNLHVNAYGPFLQKPLLETLKEDEPSDIDPALLVQTLAEWTNKLDRSHLSIRLTSGPNQSQYIDTLFFSETIVLPTPIEAKGPIRVRWIGEIHEGDASTHTVSFEMKELSYPGIFSLERPSIHWDPKVGRFQSLLEEFLGSGPFLPTEISGEKEVLHLQASNLFLVGVQLESPVMKIYIPLYPGTVEANMHSIFMSRPLTIVAQANPFEETASIQLSGDIPFTELKKSPLLPDDFASLRVDFPEFLDVNIHTELSSGWAWDQPVYFQMESGLLNLVGLKGMAGSARGHYDPMNNTLSTDSFHFQSEEYHLSGTYQHDISTDDFRFLVYGNFQPTHINDWMSEWWSNIWVDFILPYPPYIDFDISGNWRDSDNRFVYGGFRFIETTIRGLHLNQGRASIRSYPFLFEMFNLYATRPEGIVKGSTANVLDSKTKKDYAERYQFICTLDIQKAAPLFGKKVTELLETFSFTSPPTVEVSGVVFPNTPPQGDHAESLQVIAHSDSPLLFRGIELDHLDFVAEYGEEKLFISEIYFGLGGGTGEGWAMVQLSESKETPLRFAVEFQNGSPSQVVSRVPALSEAIGDRFQSEMNITGDENHRLDFMIEASGDPDDLSSFIGAGEITIQAPELADIHLLGLLSRIINELPLPVTLGSFNFNRLTTTFLLNRGLIELPDLSLSSPRSRLSASGQYSMFTQSIDFDVRVYLLGEMNVPILSQISQIFRPLANVFEFRLWGEFEDLSWRLNLDPRNLFTVPATEIEE